MPDVLEWVQNQLISHQGRYLSSIHAATNIQTQSSRWDDVLCRTMMFARLFTTISSKVTAVQMVEAMQRYGFTSYVLETLPEAVLVPLQDAISLCQPHPPKNWPASLLRLVKRSDMSSVLSSAKHPSQASSSILVSKIKCIVSYNVSKLINL